MILWSLAELLVQKVECGLVAFGQGEHPGRAKGGRGNEEHIALVEDVGHD